VTAPHFFVEDAGGLAEGSRVMLSVEDSRHALRSLRLRPGEALTLSDDAGAVASGRLVGERDGRAAVEVGETRRVVPGTPRVSVALAPPKGDRLGWAVQKLAELGVDEVVPVVAARSVREWDAAPGGRGGRAIRRLHAVAREAAMQSRQPFVMRVSDVRPFDDVIGLEDAALIVLDREAGGAFRDVLLDEPAAVRMVIGPEGGLTEEEIERARERGAAIAGLGEPVLRTETAAVVAAALVLHRYGRLG
jgi:16S rRNA (uracil1498-N3)-methyltransferase